MPHEITARYSQEYFFHLEYVFKLPMAAGNAA